MQTNDNVRSRRKEKRVASKLCIYCNRIKPLNEFYTNKGWASQSFHDAWCRECAVKNSTDRESLQAYCWYNNRLWSDTLYDAAVKKKLDIRWQMILFILMRMLLRKSALLLRTRRLSALSFRS